VASAPAGPRQALRTSISIALAAKLGRFSRETFPEIKNIHARNHLISPRVNFQVQTLFDFWKCFKQKSVKCCCPFLTKTHLGRADEWVWGRAGRSHWCAACPLAVWYRRRPLLASSTYAVALLFSCGERMWTSAPTRINSLASIVASIVRLASIVTT